MRTFHPLHTLPAALLLIVCVAITGCPDEADVVDVEVVLGGQYPAQCRELGHESEPHRRRGQTQRCVEEFVALLLEPKHRIPQWILVAVFFVVIVGG